MDDCLQTHGKLSWYITIPEVSAVFHFSGVGKSSNGLSGCQWLGLMQTRLPASGGWQHWVIPYGRWRSVVEEVHGRQSIRDSPDWWPWTASRNRMCNCAYCVRQARMRLICRPSATWYSREISVAFLMFLTSGDLGLWSFKLHIDTFITPVMTNVYNNFGSSLVSFSSLYDSDWQTDGTGKIRSVTY